MNKIIIIGRLCDAPEVRYTQNGKAVASFTLAVDFGYGDSKRTDFIPIVMWDKLAETCGNNLGKGQKILIEGRLQIRSYETNEGQKRKIAEVVAQNMEFLERKETNNDANSFGRDVFPEEDVQF